MGVTERVIFLVIGCVLGFILGYIVRSLKDIEHRLDESDIKPKDDGIAKNDLILRISLLIVVLLTAFAAFDSQSTSNHVEDITNCNKIFLAKTILALNERTTYTQDAADANTELQQSQANFLQLILKKPPITRDQASAALHSYFADLVIFLNVSKKSASKVLQNPFPTIDDLQDCLKG